MTASGRFTPCLQLCPQPLNLVSRLLHEKMKLAAFVGGYRAAQSFHDVNHFCLSAMASLNKIKSQTNTKPISMQISISIDTWHQAHHLGCALADAEWKCLDAAANSVAKWGEDEVSQALRAYAKFFRQVAKEVTKQAGVLNV